LFLDEVCPKLGNEVCPKLEDENLSEKFSGEMEIHKIDSWSHMILSESSVGEIQDTYILLPPLYACM
jgi:hypothetical protein